MYTTCTECHRQFRIRADQLNAAEGQVMCGYCGNQFNALENLSDTANAVEQTEFSSNASSIDNDVLASIEKEIEEENKITPEVEPPAQLNETKPEKNVELRPLRSEKDKVIDSVTAAEILKTADSNNDLDTVDDEPIKMVQEDDDLESLIQDLTVVKVGQDEFEEALASEPTINDNTYTFDEDFQTNEYPVDLYDEDSETSGQASTILWWCLGIILFIALVAQLAWFQRDKIMQQYPQVVTYYNQLCAKLNCKVYRTKDFSKLRIINRDVRLHPAYQNSLLVNAVMENQGDNKVPYPNIQLSLFDTNGEMVSYRRFKPEEYLEDNINIAEGMETNSPIHFVMELSGYDDNAVSFEFDFY